jgi:hypothetical protein
MPIEATIIAYLNTAMEYPAYGDTPAKNVPPHRYLVRKTGSICRDHIHTALVAIQSTTVQSMEMASGMNEALIEAMRNLPAAEVSVSACRLNSDYESSAINKKEYRYTAVFDVTYTREA